MASAAARAMRSRPASTARPAGVAAYVAAALSYHQSLDVDRPLRVCGRSSHRQLQRAELRRAGGERLSLRDHVRRADALCRDAGAELPHPELQRDRRQRRRLRACLCRSHRHRHPQRTGRALRPPAGAQSQRRAHAAGAARLGARLGERPGLAAAFQTLPGASFIVNGATLRRTPRSPRPAPSFASPTASHCSASSTASSRAAPPPMPALVPSDIRGEAICTRVPGAAQQRR